MKKVKHKNYSFYSIIILCITGIFIYTNSFRCSFHFDDFHTFVSNSKLHNINDIKSIWDYYHARFIGNLTFAINYHFNQEDVFYYHLVNLLIHLINAVLVWWLTLLIFSTPALKEKKITKEKGTLALLIGLLFVTHPINTQAVTYIVQRLASMVTMFYLLTVVLYIKARISDKPKNIIAFIFLGSFISAILAFFTKENSYTLPLIILLCEIFFLQQNQLRFSYKDIRLSILVSGFIAIICLIPFVLKLKIFEPLQPTEAMKDIITPYNYLLTQLRVIVTYIRLLILPANQVLDYDYNISRSFFEIKTLFSLLLLISLIITAIILFKKYRIISFGIFWFFLTLLIESSIIPINDIIFEHRVYLPSFGFFITLTGTCYYVFWNKFRIFGLSFIILIVLINSYLTYQRNEIWKDDLSLWSDNVRKSPGSCRAINNRGQAKSFAGDIYGGLDDYNESLRLNPHYYVAYYNRGITKSIIKDYDGAIKDFTKAIAIDSLSEAIFINRANVRFTIKDFAGAIKDYNKAIKLNPKNAKYYVLRGRAENSYNNFRNAIEDCSFAINMNPSLKDAYKMRGIAKYNNKEKEDACLDWKKASEMGDVTSTKLLETWCK